MPKKKSVSYDEPLMSRPHRNMKAKIVFDPSDNYLPKRKNKKHLDKKKSPDSKLKQISINESSLIDNSSYDINTSSHVPVPSPLTSPVRSPEIIEEESNYCFICSTNKPKCVFLDCPVCHIKNCLIINEPLWKYKLNLCPWICRNCRKEHCSKCLKDDRELNILCRCVTCKVGLHMDCYESCDIKPMQCVESNYICIPCMTLATQELPGVEANMHSANVSIVMSETSEEDEDSIYIEPSESSIGPQWGNYDYKRLWITRQKEKVPDVKTWDKFEVYNYLSQRLPSKICTKILEQEIDGCSVLLIKRKDITNKMDLTLGYALQLYKEIRILQTRSTFPGVYWE